MYYRSLRRSLRELSAQLSVLETPLAHLERVLPTLGPWDAMVALTSLSRGYEPVVTSLLMSLRNRKDPYSVMLQRELRALLGALQAPVKGLDTEAGLRVRPDLARADLVEAIPELARQSVTDLTQNLLQRIRIVRAHL